MRLFSKKENTPDHYDQIIECATKLFVEQTFQETTMQEVADKASIGIETLYSYVKTKRDLIFAVAICFWHKEYLIRQELITYDMTGIEVIVFLMDERIRIFKEYPSRYIFLEKFDNYVVDHLRNTNNRDIKQKEFLERYSRAVSYDDKFWKMGLLVGIEDHTIRDDVDLNLTIATLSLIETSVFQKLVNRRVIIDTDEDFNIDQYTSTIKKVLIEYLNA